MRRLHTHSRPTPLNFNQARLKLLAAAEKAKVSLSPYGVNQCPVSIECLMNDRDYSGQLTVEKLDGERAQGREWGGLRGSAPTTPATPSVPELAAPGLQRYGNAIKRALALAGATVSDLVSQEAQCGG